MFISVAEIFYLMLAASLCYGTMLILSAFVTGYLVFRAKRETHETLFPSKVKKAKGPIIVDEFEQEARKDDDKGLPGAIVAMNERLGVQMAKERVKNG